MSQIQDSSDTIKIYQATSLNTKHIHHCNTIVWGVSIKCWTSFLTAVESSSEPPPPLVAVHCWSNSWKTTDGKIDTYAVKISNCIITEAIGIQFHLKKTKAAKFMPEALTS